MTTQAMIETLTRRLPLLPVNVVRALYELAEAVPTPLALPDFMQATEEELAAEDALWDATTEKYAHKLGAWEAKIEADVAAGRVTGVDDDGDELRPAPLPVKEAA